MEELIKLSHPLPPSLFGHLLVVLVIEPRTLYLLVKCSITEQPQEKNGRRK